LPAPEIKKEEAAATVEPLPKTSASESVPEPIKPVIPAETGIAAAEKPEEKKFARIIPAAEMAKRKTGKPAKREPFKIIPAADVESKLPDGKTAEDVTPLMESKLPPLRAPRAGELSRLTDKEKAIIAEREGSHEEPKKAMPKTETPKEAFNETDLARLGTDITLSKINNYQELWAQTEQEGDEKFLAKTRELWKELAVHGLVRNGKEGKPTILNFTDLDGKCSLGLLRAAGIKTGDLKYVEPGKHTE